MRRVLARFAVLFALALAFVLVPAQAFAQQAANPDEVTPLTPPPVPPSPGTVAEVHHSSADLTRFLGQTIGTVDVVVEDNHWADVHPPIISTLRAGEKLTTFSVRRAMEEAVASGHSADAWVTVVQEPSGMHVTVHVMPRKIIDSIRVDLHGTPLDETELLRDAELASENELVARDIPALQARLDALLQRRGFPAPQVNISTRPTNDPLRVVLMLDISPGAPRKIERRVLYPVRATKEEIDDAQKQYNVRANDRADEVVLAAADAALEGRIRSRGRHRAEVNHDVVLHRGLVVLRVRIDYGTRFETRYEGNDHFDKSTLDGVLDLEDETDRTPNHLVQKVREYYVKHGFLDAEVRLEPRGQPAVDEVSYLVFHVTEGKRVYVAARSYPCLREDDVRKLSEGGPTSARAIGSEIDSYLEEELPGNDLFVAPRSSGLDATIGPAMGQEPSAGGKGARPTPLELDPHSAYVPETYERAVQHVQELYRAEGFLSAQVGPVQVIRRRCDPRSPAGECKPMSVPEAADVCTYDATGLPIPVASLEQGSTCVPDLAHGIECEPRVWLRIPIKLGPRTQLWDVAFGGSIAFSPKDLGKIADVKLGQYVNSLKIDEARRRVADAYKEEGYAFVDVKYQLEQSPDHTRARVRFIVSEGEKVFVRNIIVRGNVFTKTHVIERRIALEVNGPYRASLVRKTEERIATLGTFASVGVALENPYVPQKNKTVIITVVERPRQYSEVAPGFSTGEGFRVRAEYGHNNLWGSAVGLTLRLQLAYIPTPLIIDPVARDNYRDLELLARIGVRVTGSLVFPEIGLGPLVRTGVDGILVHDLQRDFYITKVAGIPSINYRPITELQFSLFNSFEFNNSRIFQAGTVEEYLRALQRQGRNTTDLQRQLLVPDGESFVVAQRFLFTWDRRDNAFNASKGTYFVSGVEHVDGYPINVSTGDGQVRTFVESHFFKLTQTLGGYIPLPKGLRIAALTRIGGNVQITSDSTTYPDRLFFMGGVDSMRGWNLNSFIPQDDVDRIFATQNLPDNISDPQDGTKTIANPDKYTPASRPIRGGNLMMNERIELRIPIKGPFETVIFGDLGNLWIDPEYPFRRGKFPIRAAVGSGIRVQTPVGPLAVDYGINVTKQPYEDFGAINFAIGLF